MATDDNSDENFSDEDYEEYDEEEAYGFVSTSKSLNQSVAEVDPELIYYECLTAEDVEALVSKWSDEISGLFSINSSQARLLLYLNKLDMELIKKAASENAAEFLKNNRFTKTGENQESEPDRRVVQTRGKISKPNFKEQKKCCGVCWEDEGDVELVSMDCGHLFCTGCWPNYIKAQVDENQPLIKCMAEKCNEHCQDDFIRNLLVSHPDTLNKYNQALCREIISSSPVLAFCAGPNCQTVVYSEAKKSHRVVCKNCNTTFCFKCGEVYHAPSGCDVFKKWLRKCADDSETANYISANTKDCIKCNASIEKNGGCNHMHCSKCGQHFCWMCMKDWSVHGYTGTCARFESKENDTRADARKALERYIYYFTRYENHQNSLKLEKDLLEKIKTRIDEKVAKHEGTWIDWQYLYDAAHLLTRCRYTLKHTYPFAYYLEGEENASLRDLFEYQQALLEKEVEELSWKVERAEATSRAELETQMHIVEHRRRLLLKDFF